MSTPPPIPRTCELRPTQAGYVVPWANVTLGDGGVDFRAAHQTRWRACWEHRLCQVCGQPLMSPCVLFGGPAQLEHQAIAAAVIIVFDAVMTYVVLKLISLVVPLRASNPDMVGGDLAIHGQDPMPVYPPSTFKPAGGAPAS